MPMSLNENQPSTTRNRFSMVANTGRLIHKSAMPRPLLSGGSGASGAAGGLFASMAFLRNGVRPADLDGARFYLAALRRLNDDAHAVGQFRGAGDHHPVAQVDPFHDLLQSIANAADFHGAALRFAVL